ncbi:MAG: MGMT family protein [Candidatus Micrarchaeota archaeon]
MGKNFKSRVYSAARMVPIGKVSTYKQIAKKAGNELAARAVGTIMHHNDYRHSKVPCHRIIKSNGSVGGYASGDARKIQILRKEGITIRNGTIDLEKFGMEL